ncbi:hypothetical protein GWO43_30665 [candidate division KSB1 bacterium]|nr:hypothetical protein [candidate division KSB1 bacterium]NIR72999.1 hypothetical protein [candidate division KSB1 bacterium]NIS28273.1 hypothetical protein [candidate division KSB1 bacterium]NIT75145.1 hypothetical protein [candidate division KSB1 bacterium]NIU28952.1 hypothetical protein [candidate division KSB1 bacterium]
MSEKAAKPKDVVTLDVETNVQTTEGRIFLNQLNSVSHVLHLKDTTVRFKGEEILKTGYLGDFKSVILYKCPKGFFLFGDKAFGKNNVSWIGGTLDEVLNKLTDEEIKKKISEQLKEVETV